MENAHDGHRKRIRERVQAGDAEALKPHELVEYLLFFAVPRRNTNPMAHRLLDHFGSLQSLFSAGADELMRVEGMSAASAEWLHLVGQAVLRYAEPDERPIRLLNRRQTRRYLREFYARPGVDGCWLLCLNTSGCLTHSLPLNAPGGWHSPENMRSAVAQALNCRAAAIILAQQRDEARLSAEEKRETEALMDSLSLIQVLLVEHVVLDREGRDCAYATHSDVQSAQLAEPVSYLAHWLDET
ncbi:MAG: JAB domain-containing protein [Clostridia bacterium]|nr:JAB domain-containing protein [Clostridia bacterium]